MISCVETIDMNAMKKILANFDALWTAGLIHQKDDNYNPIDDKEIVRTIFTKFYNRHDATTGAANTQYKPSRINPDGRVYAPYSLQTICRQVRHTISVGLIDIDLKNCHPTLLKEIFDKNSIPCKTLDEYVLHRDKVLQALIDTYDMTKDEAKTKVLAIINGASVDIDDDPWFHQLRDEVHKITNRISILYPEMYQRAVKSGGNVLHKALNYELCRQERMKLQLIIAFCKKNKLQIAAYCHDGLMLYRDATRDYQSICQTLGELCHMPVVIKEFDEAIDLSQYPNTDIPDVEMVDDTPLQEEQTATPYHEKKKSWEKTHFKTIHPYRYVEERDNRLYEATHRDFEKAYSNVYCYSYNKREKCMTNQSFPQVWMADPNIRTYHHYEFDPSMSCAEDVYNEFKGFQGDLMGGDPAQGKEGLDVFLDHLRLMCSWDEKSFDYLTKWLAWGIQKPHKKIGVALVLRGEQGSGKGTMAEYWGACIIGKPYMVETASVKDVITDGFNMAGKNKLLALFDEAQANEEDNDRMKNYITGSLQLVRQKFVDTKTNVKDYANIIFLSNNKLPVVIKPNERRHVIFRTDDRYCTMSTETTDEEKRAYFDNLYRFMDIDNPCAHTAAAVMEYMRSVDLTHFHPQLDRVLTNEYNSVKSCSMPSELKFIKDYSDDVASRLPILKRPSHTFYIKAIELYNIYLDWNKTYNPRGKPVGKTTLCNRWADYKFVSKSTSPKEGNIQYLSWAYNDLLDYWKQNGYQEENVKEMDASTHRRLLSQQVN